MACVNVAPCRGPLMEAESLTTQIQTTREADEGSGAPNPPEGPTFGDLGVSGPICDALAAGITAAFPIQTLALPIALVSHDIIGQGTNRNRQDAGVRHPPAAAARPARGPAPARAEALVVVPTRTGHQVAGDLRTAGDLQRHAGAHPLRRPCL